MSSRSYNKISRNELSPDVNQAIDAGYTRAEQAEQNSKQYTDDQISSIAETGIPKLAKYSFVLQTTESNQTVFEIPLDVFSKDQDFVEVYVNSTFRGPNSYVVTSSTETERGFITLNEPINDSVVTLIISRNEPLGEEGSVNGAVISPGTILDSRLTNSSTGIKQRFNKHLTETLQEPINYFSGKMKNGEGIIIECWGDSTYATGTPISTFQTTLRNYFRNNSIVCTNKGMSGDGTENRIKTWESDMQSSNADIIYMNYCINDAKGSANASLNPAIDGKKYRENLINMIRIARQAGKTVVLETPNPASKHNSIDQEIAPEVIKQFAQVMRDVSKETNTPLVDNYLMCESWLKKPRNRIDELLPDGYHPSEMGYRLKGRFMSSLFINPEGDKVTSPSIIPAAGPSTQWFGENKRTVSNEYSRSGCNIICDDGNATIIMPIWVDNPGMDLYLATPVWRNGTEEAEILVNGDSIGKVDLYDESLGSYGLDQEILIVENVDPGFHIVEIRNNMSTGSIGAYYLRTHPTRYNDISIGHELGATPSYISRTVQLQDLILSDNDNSTTTRSILLTDIPTSRVIKNLDIEVVATLQNRTGFVLFAHQTRDGKPHGGFYVFLYNQNGYLRVSEGDGTTDFINATTLGSEDLRGEEHVYRVVVDTSGLATLYVDGIEVGSYTLTKPHIGGFFALMTNDTSDTDVRIKRVSIN